MKAASFSTVSVTLPGKTGVGLLWRLAPTPYPTR